MKGRQPVWPVRPGEHTRCCDCRHNAKCTWCKAKDIAHCGLRTLEPEDAAQHEEEESESYSCRVL